jgi:hypothetical protein
MPQVQVSKAFPSLVKCHTKYYNNNNNNMLLQVHVGGASGDAGYLSSDETAQFEADKRLIYKYVEAY